MKALFKRTCIWPFDKMKKQSKKQSLYLHFTRQYFSDRQVFVANLHFNGTTNWKWENHKMLSIVKSIVLFWPCFVHQSKLCKTVSQVVCGWRKFELFFTKNGANTNSKTKRRSFPICYLLLWRCHRHSAYHFKRYFICSFVSAESQMNHEMNV